jgi:hypothetical protein
MKLHSLAEQPVYIKALIYGYFGAGKTRLCGTAAEHPEMKDVLLIKCEDGSLTIKHQDAQATDLIKSVSDLDDVFWSLANKKKGYETFKTVIIDSGTEALTMCVQEVVEKNCETDKSKDPDRVTIRDWGDANFIMTRLFRRFRDLPMHVLVTAQVREEFKTDDPSARLKTGPSICMPDFTPKLATRVMQYMDFVWALSVASDGVTRKLLTRPKGVWRAKTRGEEFANALGDVVENPTMPELFELLKKTSKQEGK